MRDSTSVKRHTSAGGKEVEILLVVDFSIVIVIGKMTIILLLLLTKLPCYWLTTLVLLWLLAKLPCYCLLTYCSPGQYPPPPSSLRRHVPGVHRGSQQMKLKSKTPYYCAGSLDQQEVVVSTGPPSPIDQPIAQ